MQWYKIVIVIPAIIIGAYHGIKFEEYRKGIFHIDSRKNRKK